MGGNNFSEKYSHLYDLLHAQKGYLEEVKFVWDKYVQIVGSNPKSVMDLACGTGKHLGAFLEFGAFVQGNDLSSGMVKRTEALLASADKEKYRTTVGPMQTVENLSPDGTFDLVVAYYTALGYLVEPDQLDLLLNRLSSILKPGALFFADLWSGYKMAHDFSPSRTKEAETDHHVVKRVSQVEPDPTHNALKVAFDFTVTDKRSGSVEKFNETHWVRYHTPAEIKSLLLPYGFKVLDVGPFLEEGATLNQAWNFYFIAQFQE